MNPKQTFFFSFRLIHPAFFFNIFKDFIEYDVPIRKKDKDRSDGIFLRQHV